VVVAQLAVELADLVVVGRRAGDQRGAQAGEAVVEPGGAAELAGDVVDRIRARHERDREPAGRELASASRADAATRGGDDSDRPITHVRQSSFQQSSVSG
jgi:hypothetical protein